MALINKLCPDCKVHAIKLADYMARARKQWETKKAKESDYQARARKQWKTKRARLEAKKNDYLARATKQWATKRSNAAQVEALLAQEAKDKAAFQATVGEAVTDKV